MSDHDAFFDRPPPPGPMDPLDEDELPILPDEEYEKARKLLEGHEPPTPQVAAVAAEANREQLLYARILAAGMYIGLALLLLTFTLYLTGILDPAVPIQELPSYWTLSAHEYLEAVDHNFLHNGHLLTGWAWLGELNHGDYLNYLGIAALAAVTIFCYVGILPTLVRQKDWIYSAIAVLEVVILVLAASGLVSAGH